MAAAAAGQNGWDDFQIAAAEEEETDDEDLYGYGVDLSPPPVDIKKEMRAQKFLLFIAFVYFLCLLPLNVLKCVVNPDLFLVLECKTRLFLSPPVGSSAKSSTRRTRTTTSTTSPTSSSSSLPSCPPSPSRQ